MKSRRIILKIGTGVLITPEGIFNKNHISKIVNDIAAAHKRGEEVVLISSGAITAGINKLKWKGRSLSLREKQAAAAVGQSQLMNLYEETFRKVNCLTAQILLTADDLSNRQRYLNVRNTLFTLLKHKVIPIINENDSVAVEEIKFGDNDTLSALVSSKMDADFLILLTNVEGFFTGDPRKDKKAQLIKEINEISSCLQKKAQGSGDWRSTGGMQTKLEAAKIAIASGVTTFIVNGLKEGVITKILDGENPGTKFLSKKVKIAGKKRWIAFGARMKGKIMVDEGAKEALVVKGKSLLPSGVKKTEGEFGIGDGVSIVDLSGHEFARGLSFYSSGEIKRIKGKLTKEIKHILGYKDYDEVIHRDNLVVL
ncbi:glutamate 5-kinase [bacterium]|nr:glutamate 5-kinase [bacterium]